MKKLSLLFIIVLLANSLYGQFFKEVQQFNKPSNERSTCFAAGVIDMDDNYLIIGSYCARNTIGQRSGKVEIFEKDSTGDWVIVQVLRAQVEHEGQAFGESVSIHGNTLLVGASMDGYDENGNDQKSNAGAGYLYERDVNGTWQFLQKIVSPNRMSGDYLGISADIWGDTLIIGSRYITVVENSNVLSHVGGVLIFYRNQNGNWVYSHSLRQPDLSAGFIDFGVVSRFVNGVIAISADRDDISDTAGMNPVTNAGSVFVYTRNANGYYSLSQKLISPVLTVAQGMGSSLALTESIIVAGGLDDSYDYQGLNQRSSAGSAVVFNRLPDNSFDEGQKITPNDRDPWDLFGWCVTANDDYVVVTAPRDEHMNPVVDDVGSAYLFSRDSNGNWVESQKMLSLDRIENQFFGRSLTSNSSSVVVGIDFKGYSYDNQTNTGTAAYGAFSVFEDCPNEYLPFVHVDPNFMYSEFSQYEFQWFRCTPNGYELINGATHYRFTAPDTGHYALAVTHNNCSDTVGCFRYRNIGNPEYAQENFTVYPNPSRGRFTLEIPPDVTADMVQIVDVNGRVRHSFLVENYKSELNVQLAPGVYFVSLIYQSHILRYSRLIIQP